MKTMEMRGGGPFGSVNGTAPKTTPVRLWDYPIGTLGTVPRAPEAKGALKGRRAKYGYLRLDWSAQFGVLS